MDYLKIEKLSKEFNFKTKEINGIIYIVSIFDEWYIEGGRFFTLYHKNNYRKKRKKMRAMYHIQKKFKNNTPIREIFELIKKHDTFVLNSRRSNYLEQMFEKIKK